MNTVSPKAMTKINQNQRGIANKPKMGKNKQTKLCNPSKRTQRTNNKLAD